jgi:hypothetical protein
MACDPNTLLEQARCYECALSGTLIDAVEIVLLCAIRDGDTMACDPQSLLAEASCILCAIPPGAMGAVKLSLLCQILAGGGSGGTAQVFTGAAPPAAPTDPTQPAVFYPTGGGSLLQWDIGTATWV